MSVARGFRLLAASTLCAVVPAAAQVAGAGRPTPHKAVARTDSTVSAADAARSPTQAALQLILNVPAARLDVWQEGGLLRSYRVAVGARAFPTPVGEFELTAITWNPWWLPPDSEWARNEKPQPPGPRNPMGRVKLQIDQTTYYLHGTSDTRSIGQASSHGCIRLANADALELARFVQSAAHATMSTTFLDSLERATQLTHRLPLDCRVPISIRYHVAEVRDTMLELHADVYGRVRDLRAETIAVLGRAGITTADIDFAALERALAAARPLPRQLPLRAVVQPAAWLRWQMRMQSITTPN